MTNSHRLKTVVAAVSIGLAVASTNTIAAGVYLDLRPALENADIVGKFKRMLRKEIGTDRHEVVIRNAGVTLQGGNTVPGDIHIWLKAEELVWGRTLYGISTNLGLSFNIGEGCSIQNPRIRKWGSDGKGPLGFLVSSIGHEVFKHYRHDLANELGAKIKAQLQGKVPGC